MNICSDCKNETSCSNKPLATTRCADYQEKMSEELKPCPFCGGNAILAEINGTDDYYVVCEVCCACTDFYPKEKAIKAWNSRVEDDK